MSLLSNNVNFVKMRNNIINFFLIGFVILSSTAQNTVKTRFSVPTDFKRSNTNSTSFAYFLQNLPLKKAGSHVKLYTGIYKSHEVYDAVIDLPIGTKDLHQCADAVMRLRADYLYNQKKNSEIHFNFTNGFRVDFSKWILGFRIKIKGNKAFWSKTAAPASDYKSYWEYMETVFQYAGTASLEKELKPQNLEDLQIGDVFIKGNFPGHAVIVIDKAINSKTKKIVFMLAQSYMPAQDLQVLKNMKNKSISPWFELNIDSNLETPEWTFSYLQIKSF